jgi:hypothetical protein
MRRNNENLMVLSGDDPARRSGHPLALADVLRAAVSEIEQYQRVVVRSTPSVDVLGYASGDLVRLIAELLDNATSFSPPKTHVRIGGQAFPDGSVRIEIRDEGIGMAGPELAEANSRLTAADTADVPVSRQMGLYVVGRLAKRHSIQVSLDSPKEGGLLAVVHVPAELVKPSVGPVRPMDAVVPTNGHALNGNGNGHANGAPIPMVAKPEHPSRPNLTVVPEWSSFTGSTIGDLTAGGNRDQAGFTWFDQKGAPRPAPVRPVPPPPPAPAPPPPKGLQPPSEPAAYTAVGLPRRVPRSHLSTNLTPQQPARQQARPRAEAPAPARQSSADETQRNPARARGFLNDYQAGIRQGAHARQEPSTENGQGEAT